jgi:hypothetical protein
MELIGVAFKQSVDKFMLIHNLDYHYHVNSLFMWKLFNQSFFFKLLNFLHSSSINLLITSIC